MTLLNRLTLLGLALLAMLATPAAAQPAAPDAAPAEPAVAAGAQMPTRWLPDTVAAFERLPIQDQGRIKPMATFARFELVKLSGRTTLKLDEQTKLSASEWLLGVLFDGERAATWKVIRIENPQIMQALKLPDDKKRAHFSFNDLLPVEGQIMNLASEFNEIPDRERTLFQRGMLNLFDQYTTLGNLLHAFGFARWRLPEADQASLRAWLPELVKADTPLGRYSTLIPLAPFMLELMHQGHSHEAAPAPKPGAPSDAEVRGVLEKIDNTAAMATTLHLIPMGSDPATDWSSAGTLLGAMVEAPKPPLAQVELLRTLEELPEIVDNQPGFQWKLEDATRQSLALLDNPKQAGKLALELKFYDLQLFQRALVLFILSFVLLALSWLVSPDSRGGRVLGYVLPWTVIVPTVLLVAGITLRCIIRGRPPVSTLYETTLFVPAVAIVAALITEWITRKRIALAVASALGVVGLFMANGYELKDGADTMTSLVAVLDSNFWLATHVTTVTIGYSAGLLAAALAHLYIIPRVLGLKRNDPQFYRNVARMTYGVVCFGTLFSFVGTVLGGIWANYSWGRFWGWDPKENGALLIILWNLIILHGRMGGYLRDLGICVASVFGGIIVGFSWWGVNLLGVGLHSYGFTSGIMNTLLIFTLVEMMVIFIGMARGLIERQLRAEAADAARQAPAPKAKSGTPRLGAHGRA